MLVTGYISGVPKRVEIEEIDLGCGVYLKHDTAVAFRGMKTCAGEAEITLKANSGWRSYTHQKILYEQWMQGKRKCRPARPGYSKHHGGTCVDINRSHDDPDGEGPLEGATDCWLRENARRWGFVQNVPGELWHWEHDIA